jgi:hypothetical protein
VAVVVSVVAGSVEWGVDAELFDDGLKYLDSTRKRLAFIS